MRCLRLLAMIVVVAGGCADPAHLRRDEQVIFFPSAGYPTADGSEWVLPVNGWVYRSSWWSRNLQQIAEEFDFERMLETPDQRARVYERLAPFIVHNREGRQVRVVMGDRILMLNPADQGGHFRHEIRVPARFVTELQADVQGAGPVIHYHALTSDNDAREFVGTIHIIESEGLTIVSDIDDTIRNTEVLNTKRMLSNTFVEPFEPIPGMAELYRELADQWGACVHYLSASPTQLTVPMKAFLGDCGFPEGSMVLRKVDWSSSGLAGVLDLFDAPPEFKIEDLTRLIEAFPRRRYILVGDSAQSDPEVYGDAARVFREQVLLILIHDVTCCEGRESQRYQEAFRELPDGMWVLYRDPGEIRPLVNRTLHDRHGI